MWRQYKDSLRDGWWSRVWAGEFIDFNFTTHGTLSETREAICDGDIEGRSQRTL